MAKKKAAKKKTAKKRGRKKSTRGSSLKNNLQSAIEKARDAQEKERSKLERKKESLQKQIDKIDSQIEKLEDGLKDKVASALRAAGVDLGTGSSGGGRGKRSTKSTSSRKASTRSGGKKRKQTRRGGNVEWITNQLKKNGPMGRSELLDKAKRSGKKENSISQMLYLMNKRGELKSTRKGRSTTYELAS